MKSCEEMTNSLLERRDKFEIEKKRKRKIILNTIAPICCICIIAIAAFGLFKSGVIFGNNSLKEEIKDDDLQNEVFWDTEDKAMDGDWGAWEDDSAELKEENKAADYPSATSSSNCLALQYDDVSVYYVSGNKIKSEKLNLALATFEVFKAWKEKNGIGEEVKLIRTHIDDNGTETVENKGTESSVVHYQIGDYFILNLTISKEIENYYTKADKKLLLDSLKKTMTGYSSIEYDECHIILK